MKLRGFTTKWILREAVKSILPPEILSRPKMGFPVPFALWLRGEGAAVARDVLLDPRARQRGITDPAAVAALVDGHASGTFDGGDALWSLMNLELWYRTFIDGEGVQTLHLPGVGRISSARTDAIEAEWATGPHGAKRAWRGAGVPAIQEKPTA
jgi:asparagine synthase (glutamine-hydrolysing)